jgi:hypothetical protein
VYFKSAGQRSRLPKKAHHNSMTPVEKFHALYERYSDGFAWLE